MNVWKVTPKNSKTVIGIYESYDLAEFHCTAKLYNITPLEVITKTDLIQVVIALQGDKN